MKRRFLSLLKYLALSVVFVAAAAGGSVCYFQYAPSDRTCLVCHQTRHANDKTALAGHRFTGCRECHDTAMHAGIHGASYYFASLAGHSPQGPREVTGIDEAQLLSMMDACRRCHKYAYEQWKSGGHSLTYARFLLDENHNSTELLNEDCFRCHGMFFRGAIQEAVTPVDKQGPWCLRSGELADRPAISCMACHAVHADAVATIAPEGQAPAAKKPRHSNLHLFSRNEGRHMAADHLPVAKMFDHERPVEVSDERTQRLCVQCHAPNAFHQVGTGDDRTPVGVHEGIGCAECHRAHSHDAVHSCGRCHPRMSNCGLDVAVMDTSYARPDSPHNIHTVRCGDCHPHGVPTMDSP